jgi:hypothetical protein
LRLPSEAGPVFREKALLHVTSAITPKAFVHTVNLEKINPTKEVYRARDLIQHYGSGDFETKREAKMKIKEKKFAVHLSKMYDYSYLKLQAVGSPICLSFTFIFETVVSLLLL